MLRWITMRIGISMRMGMGAIEGEEGEGGEEGGRGG